MLAFSRALSACLQPLYSLGPVRFTQPCTILCLREQHHGECLPTHDMAVLSSGFSSVLQAAQLLLVLAHGSSAAQSYLGRQDTLQSLLEVMALVPPAVLAVLLRVVKCLSTDPQLLQTLQVRHGLQSNKG